MTLVVRAAGDPGRIGTEVREAVWSVESELPPPQITLMEDALGGALATPRLNMILLGIFSTAALLLAAVALYGITAFSVARKTREIGVRIALGAPKGEVLGMVLRRGLLLVAVGGAFGLVGAYFLTRFMESLLFGVEATDMATYAAVTGILAMVMLMATLLPARGALNVDPTISLQAE
jgi:ABC-type antimicrobial peptide transport system permease subunit